MSVTIQQPVDSATIVALLMLFGSLQAMHILLWSPRFQLQWLVSWSNDSLRHKWWLRVNAKSEDECRWHISWIVLDFEGPMNCETPNTDEEEPVRLGFGGQVTPTWDMSLKQWVVGSGTEASPAFTGGDLSGRQLTMVRDVQTQRSGKICAFQFHVFPNVSSHLDHMLPDPTSWFWRLGHGELPLCTCTTSLKLCNKEISTEKKKKQ